MMDPSKELEDFKQLANAGFLCVAEVYASIVNPSRELTSVAIRICAPSEVLRLDKTIKMPDRDITQIAFKRCADLDLLNLLKVIENPTELMLEEASKRYQAAADEAVASSDWFEHWKNDTT